MPRRLAYAAVLAILILAPGALAEDAHSINYFRRFVIDGGFITWGVLIPLSVVALGLILEHVLTIRASKILCPQDYERVAKTVARGDLAAARRIVAERPSFLHAVLGRGLAELGNGHEAAEYAVIEAVEEQATRLLRKIEYLNIIGNVAPMIGLFGTVYGIIIAFNELVVITRQGGVTSPDQLAEGISISLVNTYWGLMIAIPTLAAYGVLRNRIDAFAAKTATMAIELVRGAKAESAAAKEGDIEESKP